jgi:hypothetical protein
MLFKKKKKKITKPPPQRILDRDCMWSANPKILSIVYVTLYWELAESWFRLWWPSDPMVGVWG